MGQGDPGRQHQAAGMKSRPKIGKTFHNVSFGEIASPADVAYWPLLGPREMSDLSPQSGPKQTFDQAALI